MNRLKVEKILDIKRNILEIFYSSILIYFKSPPRLVSNLFDCQNKFFQIINSSQSSFETVQFSGLINFYRHFDHDRSNGSSRGSVTR